MKKENNDLKIVSNTKFSAPTATPFEVPKIDTIGEIVINCCDINQSPPPAPAPVPPTPVFPTSCDPNNIGFINCAPSGYFINEFNALISPNRLAMQQIFIPAISNLQYGETVTISAKGCMFARNAIGSLQYSGPNGIRQGNDIYDDFVLLGLFANSENPPIFQNIEILLDNTFVIGESLTTNAITYNFDMNNIRLYVGIYMSNLNGFNENDILGGSNYCVNIVRGS